MISFSQYLMEADVRTGNYVSVKAMDPGDVWEEMHINSPKSGVAPPAGDYHATLMYSETSKEEPSRIIDNLKESGFDREYKCRVESAECFDADDTSKSCIVLKMDAPELDKMHDYLKSFGLVHSYSKFEPHVTLRYNMNVEEAHQYKELINTSLETKNWEKIIYLQGLCSETINKNYV